MDDSLAGRKILVVDDEPYILKIVAFKLRLAGLIPIEAMDGEEALRLVREERPAVVLLDVSLAGGPSGFDLCRKLKEDPSTAELPVLMLTARSLPEDRALGLSLGATSYITKPFSTKVLIDQIQQALERTGDASFAV